MWKKSLAFASVLTLIVLLDPTHTPAQPGKGSRDRGSSGGPPGGFPGGSGFSRRSEGSSPGSPPSGFPGSGFPRRSDSSPPGSPPAPGAPPAFGAPSPGGFPGGFPGGDRGSSRGSSSDAERGWQMLAGMTGSKGDVVDLSKIPPDRRAMLNSFAERRGDLPYPESGVWTKDDYIAFRAKRDAARAASAPGGSPPMGGPPGAPPFDRGSWPPPGGAPSGWNPGDWGRSTDKRKQTEEERPVAMRYGKLPKGLPGWYDEHDTDKDGQVSLYEWRKAGKDTKEFTEMDLNGDGLVTADEYLRFARQKNIDTKVAAYEEEGTRPTGGWGLGEKLDGGKDGGKDGSKSSKSDRSRGSPPGWGSKGGDSSKSDRGSDKGSDRGSDKGKGNPWSKRP